jgi:hypothetical protein
MPGRPAMPGAASIFDSAPCACRYSACAAWPGSVIGGGEGRAGSRRSVAMSMSSGVPCTPLPPLRSTMGLSRPWLVSTIRKPSAGRRRPVLSSCALSRPSRAMSSWIVGGRTQPRVSSASCWMR